jgi:hypothetical protein
VRDFVESLPDGTEVTSHNHTWKVSKAEGRTSLIGQGNISLFHDILSFIIIPDLAVKQKVKVTKEPISLGGL